MRLKGVIFIPEPWYELRVGHMVIRPDAYVDTGKMRFLIELDRSTEPSAIIRAKCRKYTSAYEQWTKPTFPQVMFIVHDVNRQRFIRNICQGMPEPRLFACWLFDEAIEAIDPHASAVARIET